MAENSRLEANQKNEPHCLQTGFLKSQMFFRKRADESNKGNAEDSQRCDQQGKIIILHHDRYAVNFNVYLHYNYKRVADHISKLFLMVYGR